MPSRYYDIDDFIADGQKIPCIFQTAVPEMGYLEHGRSESTDIRHGARLELPLWLAEPLAMGVSDEFPNGLVMVSTPAPFTSKIINALKANAVNVDLRSLTMYFFRLAQRWLELTGDHTLLAQISAAFKERAVVVNDYAYNTRSTSLMTDSSEFMGKLDDTEVKLYKAAHVASRQFKKWVSIKK
ncbi:hypothetical protein BZA70DRAFT_284394 [Myxozyma melibiosi]|uniref:DNA replication complex GINS protein PSF3 n=1 Tax=Myxozyma melibiosi TaxID=54550 RepID=A0ABR1EZF7_9ASCO